MEKFGVIFDIDGTIVDNHAHHEEAWLLWGKRNNKPIDREFYRTRLYARTNEQIFNILYDGKISPGEILQFADDKEAIYREIYGPVMEPMPGLVNFLIELRRLDIPCAAASNAGRINVDFVMKRLGLREFFRVTLASEDVARGKPAPDIFLLAAEGIEVVPAQCRVFEDSSAGFEAAHRAGMRTFAITGHSRAAELPPFIINQFRDFRAVRVEDLIHAQRTGNQ